MERVYAFTDESGAFGWKLDNPSVSSCFIIAAILVEEKNLGFVKAEAERIRQKHFQTGEMKSSKVGRNHARRLRILNDILPLPITIYLAVFDKEKLLSYPGLQHQASFYKFLNRIVIRELRRHFEKLTITADEIGTGSYMYSFSQYVKRKIDAPSLFGEANFVFEDSKHDVLIQLADFIAGTFSYKFNKYKVNDSVPDYVSMLVPLTPYLEFLPYTYESFAIDSSRIADDEDEDIAAICYKRAVDFILSNELKEDDLTRCQIIILKYLVYKFMYDESRNYISAYELIEQLGGTKFADLAPRDFRTNIIGKLRDAGVIISGSSAKKGYKIPSRRGEIVDYINHDIMIIMPMLYRLKKCRDAILFGTMNRYDLFTETENSTIQKLFSVCDEL